MERVSHLRPFRLPGGEAAVKEGWRCAASMRFETLGPQSLAETPQGGVLRRMIERGLNAPLTTSAGRLFDAVASFAGVAQESRFEGQAAMLLELAIGDLRTEEAYPLPESDGQADWRMLVESVLRDREKGDSPQWIAARFHNALANWIVAVARRTDAKQVVLSGGVFQNRYLVERAAELLEERRVRVFTHQRVPANDGGISLGQAVLAADMRTEMDWRS
jgi:hydrogenase maturation protein HypF